ncbi:GNAT family N-acetyltransferase [Paenibacillus hodogayensis]|uniref:GNAT family N-acetyltransferase n=1 Tax=Paenibacillus hodogayensis TaxID=279208 RepID=A0ABV5W1U8_9BACL
MTIRAATEADFPELRTIYLESRRAYFHWADRDAMTIEEFDKHTVDELILLAEGENGQILGFASIYVPENFIHLLFVHPGFTGKGIGSQLLDASVAELNEPIRLKCVSANRQAMTFYENKGWKRLVEESENGETYWIMQYGT